MFKKISTIATLCIFATKVNAFDAFTFVRIMEVAPNYTIGHLEVPETRCYDVSIPVYQNNRSSNGDILAGAIIGGVLGKLATNDDGGAVAGVVIGSLIGSIDGNNILMGYQNVQQCETIIVRELAEIIQGYTVTYSGKLGVGIVNTRYQYPIGTVMSLEELFSG
jgi:uncharacterized protein YcfJ